MKGGMAKKKMMYGGKTSKNKAKMMKGGMAKKKMMGGEHVNIWLKAV